MRFLLAILISTAVLSPTTALAEVWSPWADLAKFRPDASNLIQARKDRGHSEKVYEVQRIENGEGKAVNVDEYVVRVDRLPTGKNKAQFFWHVRQNLNDFFDQSVANFRAFNSGDGDDWKTQSEALLGTIMVFRIKTIAGAHDDGGVAVSKADRFSWIFSPIDDGPVGSFGTHPVAGNREFGLRDVGGHMEFYTRAFDRVFPTHVSIDEEEAFVGADKLWRSLQTNLVAYVNSNGGAATILVPNVPGGTKPASKPKYSTVCKDQAMGLSC